MKSSESDVVCVGRPIDRGALKGYIDFGKHPENSPKANLLLAAPDLLEACKVALVIVENSRPGCEASRIVKAAIDRATTQKEGGWVRVKPTEGDSCHCSPQERPSCHDCEGTGIRTH